MHTVRMLKAASRELARLDRSAAQRIVEFTRVHSPRLAAYLSYRRKPVSKGPTGFRVKHGMTGQDGGGYLAACREVLHRIRWLAEKVEKVRLETLKGDLAGLYKLREGDYRIIYELIRKEKVIIIHSIGHRRDVYQRK